MEDFYGLNEDHYTKEYTGLSPETAAALQESLGEEHPMNVEARSIRCYNGREEDHKAQEKVQNRRVNINGPHHAGSKSTGQAPAHKELVEFFIRKGMSPAEAEECMEAELRCYEDTETEPYTPHTKQEQQPQRETVSIGRVVVRRVNLMEHTEDGPTPATQRAERDNSAGIKNRSKNQENLTKPRAKEKK